LNLAETLSEYASELSYGDLGPATVKETKRRIVDALGCALGAFNEPPVRIARKVSSQEGRGGTSTILGTATKASPDLATFVNGLMIRYFDFNDTYLSKEPAHPSDNLGATFSVAESVGATGKDLILATALAYEIQCRLCDSADIRHRGWDHVCYGLVSSALAAGKLMDLSVRKLTEAVNIALNAHIAMRQVRAGELSMWKGASFSNAARNAVFAARLAQAGMTGPSPIFEGEMGFFKQVSGPFELNTDDFGGRKGGFKIEETYIKYYPAEYHSQTAVWAALAVRKRIRDLGEVEGVEIASHEAGYTILGKDPEKWRPKTKETADHSLPFIVGMALLEGKVDNSTYSVRKTSKKENLDFLDKITVVEDPRLTALYPHEGMGNRVTARLRSGERVSEEVIIPRGHPRNPMTDAEVEGKFRSLTRGKLSRKAGDRVLDALWNLEMVKDAGVLMRLLRVD
jgi:2-methylcitrate dehydratase